jgi:hypothetical protein
LIFCAGIVSDGCKEIILESNLYAPVTPSGSSLKNLTQYKCSVLFHMEQLTEHHFWLSPYHLKIK